MTSMVALKDFLPPNYQSWLLKRALGYLVITGFLANAFVSLSLLTKFLPLWGIAVILIAWALIRILQVLRAFAKIKTAIYLSLKSNYLKFDFRRDKLRNITKVVIDVFVAGALILLQLPILLIISILIKIETPGPILHKQLRMGLGGKPFYLLKFRTKTVKDCFDDSGVLQNAVITKVGRFLRWTALNEVPQLFNVLRGEMALIGHKPAKSMVNIENKSPYYMISMPGIIGFDASAVQRKADLDEWYITNWSLLIDFRIILQTLARMTHAFFEPVTTVSDSKQR